MDLNLLLTYHFGNACPTYILPIKYRSLYSAIFSFNFTSISILFQWLVVTFFVSWNHISLFLYCRRKRYSENILQLFTNGSTKYVTSMCMWPVCVQYVNTIILWPWAYIAFRLEIILALSSLFNSILGNFTSVLNYRGRTALKKVGQKLRFFFHVNNGLCSYIVKTRLMISRIYNLLV